MKLKTKITTIISFLIIILIALLSYNYKDKLYKFYNKLFYQEEITKITYNDYYKNNDYLYVQNTTDFRAKNNDHLKNIFYTIINSGVSSFTFYCNENYKECLTDVEKLANDQTKLSNINNYVHPFNSFKKIYVTYSDKGKITVKIDKTYTDEEITEFHSLAAPMFAKIKANQAEISNLTKLRDTLLPKLMSGELDVSDIDL